MRKRIVGIIISALIVTGAYFGAGALGLGGKALVALCALLFTVTWWAFQVIPPAYTALLLVLFFITSRTASTETVLNYWISPLAWLMIGAFLIARAVSQTGAGPTPGPPPHDSAHVRMSIPKAFISPNGIMTDR